MVRIDLSKARKAQLLLSSKAVKHDIIDKENIKVVAGVDVAFLKGIAIGAAVNLDYETLQLLEKKIFSTRIGVPYIPTYLAFREIGAMIGAVKKLERMPDIVIVDAHGMLHPRKAGEATHLGVVLRIPSIGVAKSMLVGKVDREGYIVYKGERLGYKLMEGVYISLGHGISLETAIEIIKRLCINNVPEPTRLAHIYATQEKKALMDI
jgi:deoxyribonuclease V